MLEIVINAFFLTQARDEVQIRLPVLHAVFARMVVVKTPEGERFRRKAPLVQNQGNDIRNAFPLKNTVFAVLPQEPQPGDNDALVMRKMVAAMQTPHFPHQPMHKPGLPGAVGNGKQRRSADNARQFFPGRRMNRLDNKLIGLANGFAAGKGIHLKIGAAIESYGKPCGIGGN